LLAGSGLLLAVSLTAILGGEVGNLGEWMSGLGAVSALGVSLYLIHDAQALRRRDDEERERRQALLVSCWAATKDITTTDAEGTPTSWGPAPLVRVRNMSDHPIYSIVVRPEPDQPDKPWMVPMWATIPPRETVESGWPYGPDRPQASRPVIAFTDQNGITWERDEFRLRVLSRAANKVQLLGLDRVSPPVPYSFSDALSEDD
jgi:hypothetical protein